MRNMRGLQITKYIGLIVTISILTSCSTYKSDFRDSMDHYSSIYKNKETLQYLYNTRVDPGPRGVEEDEYEYAQVYYYGSALDSIFSDSDPNYINLRGKIVGFYTFPDGYENLESYNCGERFSFSGELINNLDTNQYDKDIIFEQLNFVGYKVVNAYVCVLRKAFWQVYRGYDDYIIFQYQPGLEIHYYENMPPASIDTTKVNYIKIKDHWYYYSKHLESEKQKKRLKEILKDREKRTSRW
ncbi:MAG: hypothetical protein ACOC4B_01940 [Bacteroidota bacterium]